MSEYNIEPIKDNYNITGSAAIKEITDYLQYTNIQFQTCTITTKQSFHFSNYLNIKFSNILGALRSSDNETTYQQYITIGNIIQIKYTRGSEYNLYINNELILSNLQTLVYNKLISWDITIDNKHYIIIIDGTVWAEGYLTDNIEEQDFNFGINVSASYGNLEIGNIYIKLLSGKCLIKQNNQYYSIKDNTLALLGIPADDTQKEEWFNTYGVDDLKEALLTPDENGNKLIDSLNIQFQIRMMLSN